MASEKSVARVIANSNGHFSADDAWYLHATCGFYINELEALCEAKGWVVDSAGFSAILEEQRERTREQVKP